MLYKYLLLQYQSAPENTNFITINRTRYSLKRIKTDISNTIKTMPDFHEKYNK